MSLYTQVCAWDSRQSGHRWPEDMGRSNIILEHCCLAFTFVIWTCIHSSFHLILGQKQVSSLLQQMFHSWFEEQFPSFFPFNFENCINETRQCTPAQSRWAEELIELLQKGSSCSHPWWANKAEFKGHLSISKRSKTYLTVRVSNKHHWIMGCMKIPLSVWDAFIREPIAPMLKQPVTEIHPAKTHKFPKDSNWA